ncbi:hypothetical protein VDF74_06560 [Xanthomonas campestris pv. raphani]|uniref:hypothetical protein n=1 Tax=Xanthomonas campestris TaxID=339 RepID=UPI002B23A8A0|nr:hypothetical protein [Xanthomonas campestris]MEA9738652.1 hypothetical protein [Xanthomonas campestris pv. raphani]
MRPSTPAIDAQAANDAADKELLATARRCLQACAAADHSHAKALKRRGMSKGPKRYPKRSDRIELTGLRAEAASRDFVRELRA